LFEAKAAREPNQAGDALPRKQNKIVMTALGQTAQPCLDWRGILHVIDGNQWAAERFGALAFDHCRE
jgi:hypothetical protein